MSSMKADKDKLVRERIVEELEFISVTATSSGILSTSDYATAMGPNISLLEATRMEIPQRRAGWLCASAARISGMVVVRSGSNFIIGIIACRGHLSLRV